MKRSTDEKSLMVYERSNIFSGIINFFKNLFYKKNANTINIEQLPIQESEDNTKNDFLQKLKVINEDIEKLKLDVENNILAITDLTEEQIDELQEYYDKQIENDRIRLADLQRELQYLTANG